MINKIMGCALTGTLILAMTSNLVMASDGYAKLTTLTDTNAVNETEKQKGIYDLKLDDIYSIDTRNVVFEKDVRTRVTPLCQLINNNGTLEIFSSKGDLYPDYMTYYKNGVKVILKNTNNIRILDKEYNITKDIDIAPELPILGGMYSGKTFNYIAYGQNNLDNKDDAEVYRIVKYNKAWEKIGSTSVTGKDSKTQEPYRRGDVIMAENANELIIHTARKRYDGHQSNITIKINTDDMKLISSSKEFPDNHVSHSFNQFVKFDGNDEVYVDHGDAYPRSLIIQKTNGNSDKELKKLEFFMIDGEIGDNDTGLSVNGFEITSSGYMVLVNSKDQGTDTYTRNNFIALIDKNLSNSKTVWLTNYKDSDNIGLSPAFLTKIEDNKIVITWAEQIKDSPESCEIKNIIINNKGEKISDLTTIKSMRLSNIQPIYKDGKLLIVASLYSDNISYLSDNNDNKIVEIEIN